MKKSRAQEVMDEWQKKPLVVSAFIGEIADAIEQDTAEATKRVWHGPLASARGWTVPDQTGQFEIEVDVPCYVVEIERSSKVVMS